MMDKRKKKDIITEPKYRNETTYIYWKSSNNSLLFPEQREDFEGQDLAVRCETGGDRIVVVCCSMSKLIRQKYSPKKQIR